MAARKARKRKAPARKGAAPKRKKPAARRPRGRPVEGVPPDLADEVCEWLIAGRELADYCRQPGKPDRSTVWRWTQKDPEFLQRYERAREAWAEVKEEEALAIADGILEGEVVTETTTEKDGDVFRVRRVERADMVAHRRLQAWTRLQIIKRRQPKKVEHEHAGTLTLEQLVAGSMGEAEDPET